MKGIETFFKLQQRKEDMRIGGVKGWGKGGKLYNEYVVYAFYLLFKSVLGHRDQFTTDRL